MTIAYDPKYPEVNRSLFNYFRKLRITLFSASHKLMESSDSLLFGLGLLVLVWFSVSLSLRIIKLFWGALLALLSTWEIKHFWFYVQLVCLFSHVIILTNVGLVLQKNKQPHLTLTCKSSECTLISTLMGQEYKNGKLPKCKC